MKTTEERFWAKVDLSDPTTCHHWIGYRNKKGYGRFYFNGRVRSAHSAMWEMKFGTIPEGLCVLHKCDNPSCVNPDHLFTGTNLDNIKDKIAKGRGRGAVGEINGKAKLKASDIPIIRASPLKDAELARMYGVTHKAISFIREGVNWRHIR